VKSSTFVEFLLSPELDESGQDLAHQFLIGQAGSSFLWRVVTDERRTNAALMPPRSTNLCERNLSGGIETASSIHYVSDDGQ
jgi:hypothetical protein